MSQQYPPPAPHGHQPYFGPQPPRRDDNRRQWAIGLGIVGATVAVAGILLGVVLAATGNEDSTGTTTATSAAVAASAPADDAPETITVRGTITVNEPDSAGMSDFHEGAQVQILDQSNRVVGVGRLSATGAPGQFSFTVPEVPAGEQLYGVQIGRALRGVYWAQAEEVQSGLALSIG